MGKWGKWGGNGLADGGTRSGGGDNPGYGGSGDDIPGSGGSGICSVTIHATSTDTQSIHKKMGGGLPYN